MKRLLNSTAALSVALFNVQPWPLMAQTLTEDGYVVAVDGSVLCEPTAEAPCVPEDYVEQAQAIEAAVAAQAEADATAAAAAQAEADAAAAVQAEAEAAAAAQAEAEAAAAAQAEADAAALAAQAEAEAAAAAQAAAEAAGAAQAEADAAAAAQAEADAAAAAQVEADAAAAQADADAAAAAQAETDAAAAAVQSEADAAAAAEADVAAQAEADAAQADADAMEAPVTEAPAVEEPAVEEPAVAEEPAVEAPLAEEPVVEEPAVDPAVTEEPVVEPAVTEAPAEETVAPELTAEELAAQEAARAAAEAELAVEADGTPVDPAAGLVTAEPVVDPAAEPVEAPVPTETEVQTLTDLLAQPNGVDPTTLGAAETLLAEPLAEGISPADAAPSPTAVDTVTQMLTETDTRSSSQEFAAAPVVVAAGKKNRLSDLEKVGLVALGALVVGAIISENNKGKAERAQVVSNTGDRVVVLKPDGTYQVYKDDDAVIRQPGSTVRTETYGDGSTRTIVERTDGSQIVTIRDATGRVLRRAQYDKLGRELVLINDLQPEEEVIVTSLPKPKVKRVVISTQDDDAELKAALAAKDIRELGRTFSLRQIREISQVRALAAMIDVDSITFDSGSSAIKASEAADLADLGRLMQDMIDRNPGEMFLIEGHTDAVGKAAMNLALSDRRAESVALALTEYFDIPPENMVIQGYGETELRIDTLADEKRNRRVAVRIITPLMRTAS